MLFLGQTAGELPATQPTTNTRPITRPNSLKATGLAAPENTFHGKALYKMGRSLLVAYTRLMLDVDVQWHAPLPEGPKILAANHPTTTDPLYLLTLLSEPMSVLTTAASFDVPGVGAYLRATGHVPAVRGSGGATVDAVARQVEAGRSVAIFPEGALSPLAGGFHRPHSGVARVALRTGAPVIPIGIGLQRDRIRVTETEVDDDKVIGHLYASGPYALTVGRPLTFEGDVQDRERVRAVAGHIMNHVRNLASESERRIRPVQAAEAGILPAPAWPASGAGAPAPVRSWPW
jgi:1-acyl-sn-glycerol-3-phosphate acyltransferase